MPERFSFIPFVLSTAQLLIPSAKVNVTRIIEALIIAMLTAGVVTWRTTEVLTVQIASLKEANKAREDEGLGRYKQLLEADKEIRTEIKENRVTLEEHVLEQLRQGRVITKSLKENKEQAQYNGEQLKRTLKAPWR